MILKPAKESIYLKGPNVLTEYFVTKQIIFEEENILLINGSKTPFHFTRRYSKIVKQDVMSVNLNSERQFEDGNTFSIYIFSTQTTHFN